MLLHVDSFSHYDSNTLLAKKWDAIEAGTGPVTMTQGLTSGRFGGGGVTFTGDMVTFTDNLVQQYMQWNYDGVATIIAGLAVEQTSTQIVGNVAVGSGARLISFMEGATLQVGIQILPSGQLRAISNLAAGQGFYCNTTTIPIKCVTLGTSTSAISSSSADFLEFKVIHATGTSGSIEVKRNGEAFWTLTGVNTAISGNAISTSVIVGGFNATIFGRDNASSLNAIVSDFHLLNTTVNGSDPNDPVDFIGDRHWEVVTPSADSTPLDWTTDGSTNHWENVNDIPPNVAANNNSDTVGNQDALLYTAMTGPASATVLLSYTMYLEKDTGGAVGVSGLMVSPAGGGGTAGNGTEFQVPNPIAFRQSFLCTDPAAPGTDPLTVAIVNAGGHGYERTS